MKRNNKKEQLLKGDLGSKVFVSISDSRYI